MEDYEVEYEVEIDLATSDLLATIARADNDAFSLAEIAHIDPERFREFLSETGVDNQDATELLTAAEALRSRQRNSNRTVMATPVEFAREEGSVAGFQAARHSTRAHPSENPTGRFDYLVESPRRTELNPFYLRWSRPGMLAYAAATIVAAGALFGLASYLRRPTIPSYLSATLKNLDAQVGKMPDLFDAPSPRLQIEFLSRTEDRTAERELVLTLYNNRTDLPESALKRAALLAFALEDYSHASALVETGLSNSSDDKQLLATRGLIEYGQSLYPQAASSFQEAWSGALGPGPNARC
jgi:hypothetical protein